MCVQESMQDAPVMQCPSRTLFAARIHLHARKICNIAESGRVRCVSCVYKFSSSRNVTPLRAFHIPPPAYRLASLSAFFFSSIRLLFRAAGKFSSCYYSTSGSPGRARCRRCCLLELAPI